MHVTIKAGKPVITLHEADKRKLAGASAILRFVAVNTDNESLAGQVNMGREAIADILATFCETPEVDTPRETLKAGAA
jgi:hypothetical protein